MNAFLLEMLCICWKTRLGYLSYTLHLPPLFGFYSFDDLIAKVLCL